MLSTFPTLFSYQELAPFLLRITLGVIFLFWAYKAIRKADSTRNQKIVAAIEFIIGLLLIVGMRVQVAAHIAIIDLIVRLIERAKNKAFLTDGVNYYLILLVMALSLMVLGAGWWGFDVRL
ncbi:MAG: hypothetical protein NTZ38_01550 [Candidatus Taylorbacteria bacterium]|nr:hypothetical protein [Candidatus Taylorbacteria bacterium]